MRKLFLLFKTIFFSPFRLFSKISPFTLIKNSDISNKASILSGTRFYNSTLGDYSYICRNCYINNTDIGKYCSISDNVYIGMPTHPVSWVSTSPVFHVNGNNLKCKIGELKFSDEKKTIIENDVWIGLNVCIMHGVKIGNGAIIGAGSVVTKDVDSYAIVGGNPAKLIRYRFEDNIIKKILESSWWDRSDLVLLSKYFDNPNLFLEKIGE